MRIPYIGITDFETTGQVLRMVNLFEEAREGISLPAERRLMVGVMISFKTLMGVPSKWTLAWLPKEKIAGVFIEHPAVFNTLHYADFDGATELEHLRLAANFGGANMHAIQLDMIWPSPDLVRSFREEFPHIAVVLQVNARALEQIDEDPEALVSRLKGYGSSIDFVLLDKSMGRGKGMDAGGLLPFAEAVDSSDLDIGLSTAGGLGPDSLHLVASLVERFPDSSIDAQGQLRPSGNALDPIDWLRAGKYLTEALEMYEN